MPRSDGSPEEQLNDSQVLLSAVGKSGGFRLSPFNGRLDKRFNFGNGHLLTKSRTLPSNARTHVALPVFPGPLLPTVRRLNSSPDYLREAVSSTSNVVPEEKFKTGLPNGTPSAEDQPSDDDTLILKTEETSEENWQNDSDNRGDSFGFNGISNGFDASLNG
eukprot:c16296_g1_i1 orf=138-623(+)